MAKADKGIAFDRDKFMLETWPEALESGRFKKTTGQLCRVGLRGGRSYCCLAVAEVLLEEMGVIPPHAKGWEARGGMRRVTSSLLGISSMAVYKVGSVANKNLGYDNDSGKTFKQIAKIIRRVHKLGLWVR